MNAGTNIDLEPDAGRGFSGRIVLQLSATCPENAVTDRRFAHLVRSMLVIPWRLKLSRSLNCLPALHPQ